MNVRQALAYFASLLICCAGVILVVVVLTEIFSFPPKKFKHGDLVQVKFRDTDKAHKGYVTHHIWATSLDGYTPGWKANVMQGDGKGEFIYEFLLELVPQGHVERERNDF